MAAVINAYEVNIGNHNSQHQIHTGFSTIEYIHSFSKRNEPCHTRFEKINTGRNKQIRHTVTSTRISECFRQIINYDFTVFYYSTAGHLPSFTLDLKLFLRCLLSIF